MAGYRLLTGRVKVLHDNQVGLRIIAIARLFETARRHDLASQCGRIGVARPTNGWSRSGRRIGFRT